MNDRTDTVGSRVSPGGWTTQARAFAERHLRETSRSKVGLFWSFAFPVIWYLLTVHLSVMPGIEPAGRSTAKAVLGVSFGVFGAFTVTLVGFTGNLAADVDAKRYRKFRSLPVAPSADLGGRFASGAALGFVSWAATVAVAVVDGATYRLAGGLSAPIVVLSVVLFCLVGMVAGMAMTLVVPRPEHATTAATGIVVVGFFVTGYNGIVPGVFPAGAWLLNVVPNSLATRLVVYHLVDSSWGRAGLAPPGMPDSPAFLLLLAAYAVCLTAIGTVAMRRAVYGSDLGE